MTLLERKLRGDPLRKGQWYLNQDAEICVVCPKCGGVGNLNDHKTEIIGASSAAEVIPSVEYECGFHDQVALKDFELSGG